MNLIKMKWLVPFLAILVIFESVLIVQKLDSRREAQRAGGGATPPVELKEVNSVSLTVTGDEAVASGDEGEAKVVMTTLKDVALDGIDVLVEYDPEYLEVIGVEPSAKFSNVARNWIEPEKKRILVSMLEVNLPEGVSFGAGEETVLLTIRYVALKPGETTLRIIGGEDEAGTVLAENGTAKKIPFDKQDLIVTIE